MYQTVTYVIIRPVHWSENLDYGCRLRPLIFITDNYVLDATSALRLLALRGLRTHHVRTRAFGPRFGEKLLLIFLFLKVNTISYSESANTITP